MRRACGELPLSERTVSAIEHVHLEDELAGGAARAHLGDQIRLRCVHEHAAAETCLHGTDELGRREAAARPVVACVVEQHARRGRRLCPCAPRAEREPEDEREELTPAAGHSTP